MIEDQTTTIFDLVGWVAHKCVQAGKKGEEGFMEAKLWAEYDHTVEMLLELKNKPL